MDKSITSSVLNEAIQLAFSSHTLPLLDDFSIFAMDLWHDIGKFTVPRCVNATSTDLTIGSCDKIGEAVSLKNRSLIAFYLK